MEGATNTYKSVGKSFVLFEKSALEKDLAESVAFCEAKVESLTKESEIGDKQRLDVENQVTPPPPPPPRRPRGLTRHQIRELLSSNPSLLRMVASNVAA